MSFVVAIDGPAAAGKGTLARALAQRFGFAYLDTGLLYRTVGMKVRDGQEPVVAATSLHPDDLKRDDLRGIEAAQFASKVAVIPEVRHALLAFQRSFAAQAGGAILDGRDIGTVICPDADLKLFVTARAEVRAKRRWQELNGAEPYEDVLRAVIERDERDTNRSDAPLRPASDAHVLDTSDLSIEHVLQQASALVQTAR